MTDPSKTSNTQTENGDEEPLKVTFSLPQILGGALAAATAATIGSTLGVAGTIIGASVASVIGGVAGTLYSAGLDRTHRRARTAMKRVYSRVRVAEPSDDETAATAEGMPEAPQAAETKTQVAETDPAKEGEARRDWRPILKRMAITAAAIFVVTLGVITAIELGLGSSLGGTTIGQVTVPKARPTPTATATETVTVTPTPTASTTAPTPSASQTPSFTPTPGPSSSPASELPSATSS